MIGLAISAAALVGLLVGLFVGTTYGAGRVVHRIRDYLERMDTGPADDMSHWDELQEYGAISALLDWLLGGKP